MLVLLFLVQKTLIRIAAASGVDITPPAKPKRTPIWLAFVQNQFLESASGAVVKNIRADIVKKTMLPIPPFEEQKEIVKKVENLFAICDQLEEQITSSQTNAEQLMQSVLKEAFSQDEKAA